MQTIHQQIIHEIQQIPESKLVSLYDIIHYFRLGLIKDADVHTCQNSVAESTKPAMPKNSLHEFIGALKNSSAFTGDPVVIQQAMRDEWN